MSLELWHTAFSAVGDVIITMFGYFFDLLGAATGALLAITIFGAVVRLIVKPILGYSLDLTVRQPAAEKIKTKVTEHRDKKKYGIK